MGYSIYNSGNLGQLIGCYSGSDAFFVQMRFTEPEPIRTELNVRCDYETEVYNNLTYDEVYVNFKYDKSRDVSIQFYNAIGQFVLEKQVQVTEPNQEVRISTENLTSGFYAIRIAHAESVCGHNMVKLR